MKKICLILCIIMLLSVPSYAKTENASLPAFDVTLNTQKVDSSYREYPLIVYKDITYFPMTYYDCRYLGISTDWDAETNTLSISKSGVVSSYRGYEKATKNANNFNASICSFNIIVNGQTINNAEEEYPLLLYRDVTYFPLTWRFAVYEFGWDYSFDHENGLIIKADTPKMETVSLPYLNGSAATDGKYYYYNALKDGSEVVCRAAMNGGEPEVIFTLPDSHLSNHVNFRNDNGEIYFTVTVGTTPITSHQEVYKIYSDGTVTEEAPLNYSDNSKYGVTKTLNKGGISINIKHYATGEVSEFSYTKDGKTVTVDEMHGRRIRFRRNGINIGGSKIQIFNDKIYYSATEAPPKVEGTPYNNKDSSLYVIDTVTGEHKKLLEGVCGFHVYNGWYDEKAQDSTMILYDNDGILMRYTELDGVARTIGDESNRGLVLENAVGAYQLYAVLKAPAGDRTVVKTYDCYASGAGSINGTLLETTTGTYNAVKDGKLVVTVYGEYEKDDVRILVMGDIRFFSADTVNSLSDIFIYDNIILYPVDGKIVKVTK